MVQILYQVVFLLFIPPLGVLTLMGVILKDTRIRMGVILKGTHIRMGVILKGTRALMEVTLIPLGAIFKSTCILMAMFPLLLGRVRHLQVKMLLETLREPVGLTKRRIMPTKNLKRILWVIS